MITLILFILLSSNLIVNFSYASHVSTIKLGDRLNFTSQLLSPGRRFTLGFFTIRETECTYLGLWYTFDTTSTKVWIANRSTPIKSSSIDLMIDPDTGKLIIATGGTTIVNVSDNQSGASPNLTATLEDTGDFQLKNEINNRIVWRSFDYPTNVLLPGMKLGSDLRTGRNWTLTSWLSDTIPDLGAFTMSFEASGTDTPRLMIRRRGQPYWSKLVNELSRLRYYEYNISYAYNNEERYISYYGESCSGSGCTTLWILNANGQVAEGGTDRRFLWSTEFCYGYDSGNGCVAGANLPLCRSRDDKFTLLKGEFYEGARTFSRDNNSSLSFSDCMMRCWNDCGCLAFNSRDNGVGCGIWTGTKDVKFETNPLLISVPMYVLVSPSKGNSKILIWGPVVSGIFLLLFGFGLLWYRKNRKLKQEEEREKDDYKHLLELMDSSDVEKGDRKGSDLVVFSFAAMVTATNDFSDV